MDTFANRLKEALKESDMKQTDLSRATGIDKSLISNYLSGKYKAKQENLHLIANALNVSELWLMGHDVEKTPTSAESSTSVSSLLAKEILSPLPRFKKLPLIGSIACGKPILAEENVDDQILCPDDVEADFCLRCKGDSMIGARIHDGDIVYIRLQPDVENGEIAAVLIDDEATLKRVYKKRDSLVLQPENPAYEPLIFVREEMNSIRILGKAVCFFSKVK
jgi:repressor LexA